MKRELVRGIRISACAVGVLLATSTVGLCATLFYDSFEPPVGQSQWTIGPDSWRQSSGHHMLEGEYKPRTPGVWGLRSWVNWRYPYNSQRQLGANYDSNVYVKCWIWEDNDILWPPGPATQYEGWPNGYLTLLNSAWLVDRHSVGADACMIGVIGEVGRANGGIRDFFDNCCVYTAGDDILNESLGYHVLNGDPEYGVPLVPRRQGWRKYTILVNGYTGNPGDVQFFIDDKLVYNGLRKSAAGGGGAPFDTVVLGSEKWTYETYYYDQVEFGTIETAVNCSTISEAKALPDDTWAMLESKVVAGCFGYSDLPQESPTQTAYARDFPGYVAIEENDRSAALWVSTSYQPNFLSDPDPNAPRLLPSDRINVKGIMRTNEAGMRYLDAIEITHAADPVSQPGALGTTLKGLGSPLLDGKLVKVWGRVVNIPGVSPETVHGQERPGDWRRYFLIDDGSSGGPVKCYYGNVIREKPDIDPEPAVKSGDYVTVIGVPGREVLVPGSPDPLLNSPQKSVWIRGAGDLKIVLAAL